MSYGQEGRGHDGYDTRNNRGRGDCRKHDDGDRHAGDDRDDDWVKGGDRTTS